MQRRSLILALALTLPLASYGIPYVYAATQSTYVVSRDATYDNGSTLVNNIMCLSTSDYSLSYGLRDQGYFSWFSTYPLDSNGHNAATGSSPNGWQLQARTTLSNTGTEGLFIMCQSPVTVAGIGVPQFGSLYVAIALGAVVYFMLSRRFTGRPTISTQA